MALIAMISWLMLERVEAMLIAGDDLDGRPGPPSHRIENINARPAGVIAQKMERATAPTPNAVLEVGRTAPCG